MRFDRFDLLILLGLALMIWGAAWIYAPLGPLVGGLALFVAGVRGGGA